MVHICHRKTSMLTSVKVDQSVKMYNLSSFFCAATIVFEFFCRGQAWRKTSKTSNLCKKDNFTVKMYCNALSLNVFTQSLAGFQKRDTLVSVIGGVRRKMAAQSHLCEGICGIYRKILHLNVKMVSEHDAIMVRLNFCLLVVLELDLFWKPKSLSLWTCFEVAS